MSSERRAGGCWTSAPVIRDPKPNACCSCFGSAAGPTSQFNAAWLQAGRHSLIGFSATGVPSGRVSWGYATVAGLAVTGLFEIPTECFGLEDVGEAWRLQRESPSAMIILKL